MSRIVPFFGVIIIVPGLLGCGLFNSSKPYQFQEPPPYYQSQKDEMVDHARIFRQSELGRLEQDASAFESERKREELVAAEKAEKEKKKKKGWMENWFGKGDETFLMSSEARKINANLER